MCTGFEAGWGLLQGSLTQRMPVMLLVDMPGSRAQIREETQTLLLRAQWAGREVMVMSEQMQAAPRL